MRKNTQYNTKHQKLIRQPTPTLALTLFSIFQLTHLLTYSFTSLSLLLSPVCCCFLWFSPFRFHRLVFPRMTKQLENNRTPFPHSKLPLRIHHSFSFPHLLIKSPILCTVPFHSFPSSLSLFCTTTQTSNFELYMYKSIKYTEYVVIYMYICTYEYGRTRS